MKRSTVDHPKFERLQKVLTLKRWQAMGLLEALWHFTAKFASQGDVGRWSDEEIADWIGWEGSASELIAALVKCRWLDEDATHRLLVHDWHDHADGATKISLKRADKLFLSGTVLQQCRDKSEQCRDLLRPPEPCPARAMPEPCPAPSPLPPSGSVGSAGRNGNENGILPDGTRRLTERELESVDDAAEAIGLLREHINPTVMRSIQRLFAAGCDVELWDQVVDEEKKPGLKSLQYFVTCCQGRMDELGQIRQPLANGGKLPAAKPDHDDMPAKLLVDSDAQQWSEADKERVVLFWNHKGEREDLIERHAAFYEAKGLPRDGTPLHR